MKTPNKRQRGYLHISNAGVAVLVVIIAVCGWACIEAVRWALSHLALSVVP